MEKINFYLFKSFLFSSSSASGNRIKSISKGELPKSLTVLELRTNPLSEIKAEAMHNMTRLRKL